LLDRTRLQAAEQAFAKGNDEATLRFALDELRLFRWSKTANLLAARALSRQIFPLEAEPYYRAAERLGSIPLDAQHDRIQGLLRAVKNEQGVARCYEVLKGHPTDPKTLRFLATAEWLQGRLPEAREAAERLSRTKEGEIDGLDLLATIHRDADRRAKAIEACEQILRLDPELKRYRPGPLAFWKDFTEDLVVSRRAEEAREFLRKVITPQSDPMLLDLLGAAQKDLNEPEAAAAAWKESARRDPSRLNPWVRLGSISIMLKQFPQAIDALERAVALAPDHVEASQQLARAYQLVGRTEEAKQLFKRVETLRKNAPPTPGAMRPSP
jgi:tetratricopeptide (TPR) repeat protein